MDVWGRELLGPIDVWGGTHRWGLGPMDVWGRELWDPIDVWGREP